MSPKMQNTVRLTLSYIAIAIACVIILYPVLWIVGSSFNPGDSLSGSSIIPKDAHLITINRYLIQKKVTIYSGIGTRLKICVITMILAVAMISCMALCFLTLSFCRT